MKKRLHLHSYLQPVVVWLGNYHWAYTTMGVCGVVMAGLTGRHSSSLWPCSGIILYMVLFWPIMVVFLVRRKNIICIAESGDIAAVGPLLDLAESTFLDMHDTSNRPKPKSEALVLSHLPALLARMPAGDGPDLTLRQRSTLNRLYQDYRYQSYFSPELRDKIAAIVDHNR